MPLPSTTVDAAMDYTSVVLFFFFTHEGDNLEKSFAGAVVSEELLAILYPKQTDTNTAPADTKQPSSVALCGRAVAREKRTEKSPTEIKKCAKV